MGRAVRIGLAVTGLLLLCLLVALLTVDLGRFKSPIVRYASAFLERPVQIDGQLSIELGRQIRVSAEAVRVASEPWTEYRDLVSIERFTITLDTSALLNGIAQIELVEANGIDAHLAVNENGNDNWTFAGLATESDEPSIPVVVRQASVTGTRVSYTMPDLPTVTLRVADLTVEERNDLGLQFELTGSVNDTPLMVIGALGTAEEIIEGKNVPFELNADLGEISVSASGQIDDLYDPRQPEVALAVQGPNAEYLTDVLELVPITTGPFSIQASSSTSGTDTALRLEVDGTYGEFDIALTGQLADLQTLDPLQLNVEARGPSIGTIARLAGQPDLPALPFTMDAEVSLQGKSLEIPRFLFDLGAATVEASASLPAFPGLEGAAVSLLAAGPQLGDVASLAGLPDGISGPFQATVELDRVDTGSVLDAKLDSEVFQASASGELTDDPGLVGSNVSVAVRGDDAARIGAALEAEGVPSAPFSATADLTIGAEAIQIANGTASLADLIVEISGRVAAEPLSEGTRLQLATELEDPVATLNQLGFEVDGLPKEMLAIDIALSGAESAVLIEPLTVRLGGTTGTINARLAEPFDPANLSADVAFSGSSLAELLPLDSLPISDQAFSVAGRLSFDDRVRVTDLEAGYGSATAVGDLSFALDDPLSGGELQLAVQGDSLFQLMPVAADYVSADAAFNLSGGGRWQPDSLWLENARVLVGDVRLVMAGELHLPPDIAGTMLTVDAALPSLKILEAVTDQPLPDEPLTLKAELAAEDAAFQLETFALTLGQSDLSGSAMLRLASSPEQVPEMSAKLSSTLLDLQPLQALLASDSGTAAPQPAPADGRLIPDTPVPLEQLRAINGDVQLAVGRMLFNNTTLADVELNGSIRDGALTIDRFALRGEAGGELSGSMALIPTESSAGFSLTADGDNMIVGLPAADDEARAILPRYELDTRLAASGSTIREMAASSKGYLRLVAGEGRVALGPITAVMGDFMGEVFDSINPFAKKEPESQVQCMAALVEINEGILVGKPAAVLQTDKLNIIGTAKIDLSTEKLNARFNTQARRGIGIGLSDLVSPLTEVGGTLASPRLQLNTTGTLVEGGAAVATVGISFLAKKARDRLFSNRHPCRTAIEKADQDLEAGGVPLSEPNSSKES